VNSLKSNKINIAVTVKATETRIVSV